MINKLMNRNGENLMARKKRLPQNVKTQIETTADGIKITVQRNQSHGKRLVNISGETIAYL